MRVYLDEVSADAGNNGQVSVRIGVGRNLVETNELLSAEALSHLTAGVLLSTLASGDMVNIIHPKQTRLQG